MSYTGILGGVSPCVVIVSVNIRDILPVLLYVQGVGGCGQNLPATELFNVWTNYLDNKKSKKENEAANNYFGDL